jgi:hypothetical protein
MKSFLDVMVAYVSKTDIIKWDFRNENCIGAK